MYMALFILHFVNGTTLYVNSPVIGTDEDCYEYVVEYYDRQTKENEWLTYLGKSNETVEDINSMCVVLPYRDI